MCFLFSCAHLETWIAYQCVSNRGSISRKVASHVAVRRTETGLPRVYPAEKQASLFWLHEDLEKEQDVETLEHA